MLKLLCGLSFVLLFASPLAAREQNDAPDAEVIGFSADGRYFAFEQYQYDIVSDALVAAIFVVDRETNGQAAGFPFGVLAEERDGAFPAMVGGFDPDPKLLDTNDYEPDLPALRRALRDAARPKLDALGIGVQGRRLAGAPMTQRSPQPDAGAPLGFVLSSTIPGPIPDLQPAYTITATPEPEVEDCANLMPPARTRKIAFEVSGSLGYPETKEIGRVTTTYDWAMEKESCFSAMWIADVIAPPAAAEASVAVLFLATTWESFTEGASWHALFVGLPRQP